jgi:hypothetical protein
MYNDERFEFNNDFDEFDRLDQLVEIARESFEKQKATGQFYIDFKYYAYPSMVKLMAQEVDRCDIRQYQEISGFWITEIIYRGIRFITSTPKQIDLEID